MSPEATRHQQLVDEHFQNSAGYWKSVYAERNLDALLYQYRQAAALYLIDLLRLPADAQILEVGCGSGALTIAIARRGYRVTAMDRVDAMLNFVRRRGTEDGVSANIETVRGDVHRLDFGSESFHAVLGLGIIPWLHSPDQALAEILRVLKPGGQAVITADNRNRLNHLLDPRFNPLFRPLRNSAKRGLEILRVRRPSIVPQFPVMHSVREFDALIASAGFEKSAGITVAFGPFTFGGKRMFPDRIGKRVHRLLQNLANRNVPGIRLSGSHYIVLARRPPHREQRFLRETPQPAFNA